MYKYQDHINSIIWRSLIALDGNHGLGLEKFLYDNMTNDLVPIYYDSDSDILRYENRAYDSTEDKFITRQCAEIIYNRCKIVDKINWSAGPVSRLNR